MKAQVIKQFGATSVFETLELPKPKIKSGYVLIRVMATSVNPLDYKIRSGAYAFAAPQFPAILHGDVAGIIEEIGEGVNAFNIGDEVYGCAGGLKEEQGALAEYMLADARLIAKKPKTLTMTQAAALPLVGITAWEALFDKCHLKAQQKILIHAGTGGVGHVAIQLAKWAGAEIYTTVSTKEKAEIAKSLGAATTINYREETVQQYVNRLTADKGFDVVLDTIGGENIDKSITAVGYYGNVATIQARSTHDLSLLFSKSASLHAVFMIIPLLYSIQRQRYHNILIKIAELVDGGYIKPLIDAQLFSFEHVGKAHALLESGKAIGKVVLTSC